MSRAVVDSLLVARTGCPPPGAGGGRAGGARGGINPDACGAINTNPAGRKLHSFLVASAELDRASIELEQTVANACRSMASILGVPTGGDTKQVCTEASKALEANLQIEMSASVSASAGARAQ